LSVRPGLCALFFAGFSKAVLLLPVVSSLVGGIALGLLCHAQSVAATNYVTSSCVCVCVCDIWCPQPKAECYVNSGGVGMTNTKNRAELTRIAAALTNEYTKIATDSACFLSQISLPGLKTITHPAFKHAQQAW